MTMGPALREIGSGQVVVLMRNKTSEIKSTVVPVTPNREKDGLKVISLMGEDHIRINAVAFREIGSTDIWEFRVLEKNPQTSADVVTLWYVSGVDVLCLMALSKVL